MCEPTETASLGDDTHAAVKRPKRAQEHGLHTECGPFVSVGSESSPLIGAKTRMRANKNVRPRHFVDEQAKKMRKRRRKRKEEERDKEKQTKREIETKRKRKKKSKIKRERERKRERDPSKGSRRANYLILTQRGGDKKEQYTGIRAMTDCICTLFCGAAIGTFTFEELQVFQTSACGELTLGMDS